MFPKFLNLATKQYDVTPGEILLMLSTAEG